MRINFDTCKNRLDSAKNIAVFCHIRPDGDTLGAALGLKLALSKIGKTCSLFCEDKIPENLIQFGFGGHFCQEYTDKNYDLYLAIDCGDLGRLGVFSSIFEKKKNTLTIDHHMGHSDFGALTYVDGLSSTCEIVLNLINAYDIPLNKEIATVLFVGLSTDTGNFKHSNTTQKTFSAAVQLSAVEIDIAKINRVLYNENKFCRLKLLSRALSNMRQFYQGRLCVMYLSLDDFAAANATMEDTEGFTDYSISVDTAQVGVCISQKNANSFKISMRSKGVNVAEICQIFGGGGHQQASGCVLCGFLEDVIDKIVKAVGNIWTDL